MLRSYRLMLMVAGVIVMIVLIIKSVQRAATGVDGHYWFAVFYGVAAVYFGFRVHQVWQQLKAEKNTDGGKDG